MVPAEGYIGYDSVCSPLSLEGAVGSSAAWTGVSGGEGAICLLISLLISSIGLVKAMRTSSSLLCKNKVVVSKL